MKIKNKTLLVIYQYLPYILLVSNPWLLLPPKATRILIYKPYEEKIVKYIINNVLVLKTSIKNLHLHLRFVFKIHVLACWLPIFLTEINSFHAH